MNDKSNITKVFISSTFIDLKDYRQKALETVTTYKCLVLGMEYFGAQPKSPKAVCKEEIEECDIFIGIYAHRYGSVPGGEKKSITRLEYELARKLGKDCLCFIVDDNHPWPPKSIEGDKSKELRKFLDKVQKELVTTSFTTPTDLGHKLAASLGKLLVKKAQRDTEQKTADRPGRNIPIARTRFMGHSYPLQTGFTGREAEKALLSHWLQNAEEPVMVLEAIGGMGKSALSWVWLQEEVLAKNNELDGVLWWSFYDEPFESFLAKLFHYLTAKEVKIDPGVLVTDLNTLHSILYNNRFLLILDGFERALRGYAGMSAMFLPESGLPGGSQNTEAEREKRLREPVHPQAARFLQYLCAGQSKTLLTTRLFPAPLEDLAGVGHILLPGLSGNDTVHFFRSEGISGSRAEMERAGQVYDFHPLMLKLLSTAIKRSRLKDIESAFSADLIHKKEPQKILSTSFQLLKKAEQKTVSTLAIFRGGFTFAAAQALVSDMEETALWEQLVGLRQLGFLFYNEAEALFDFHPILRSFLYDGLTDKNSAHERAIEYFQALPKTEKVITLVDLAPVIELYHHLTGSGKYDEACKIYQDRLVNPLYFQLANYSLAIELLKALFPDGEDRPPRLTKEGAQAWALNELANSYALSGQPGKAVPLYLLMTKLYEKVDDPKNLVVGLENVAIMAQIYIGQLSAVATHLRKTIMLSREIKDEFGEAVEHQELGRILAYQGCWDGRGESYHRQRSRTAEEELAVSTAYWDKTDDFQGLSVDCTIRFVSFLGQARLAQVFSKTKKNVRKLSWQALEQASKALEFSEKQAETIPVLRDFIRAYWMLGEGLILSGWLNLGKPFEIHLYDEHFQDRSLSLKVVPGQEWQVAESCLNEALRRCRKANLVEMEAVLLLAQARLAWVRKGQVEKGSSFAETAELLQEARQVAERAGYRLQLADIHLFCGEVLLAAGRASEPSVELLGISAREHLQKAKSYALDMSEFSHLYQSEDPQFYEGIAEYEMLKRGLSEQERIEHGYWVAWQIADALEKRLK